MTELSPRFREIFFEVYENLPRQGPGNRACAARALGFCRDLPDYPEILDLGCGVGGQTFQLAIHDCGFEIVGNFALPDEAWWDDFYTPMEARIVELRSKYAGDHEELTILDQIAAEPEMHRRYSDFYGYEFFVVRRPAQDRDKR